MERYNLPERELEQDLGLLRRARFYERLDGGDYTLWSDSPEEISNRLGWMFSHRSMKGELEAIQGFADGLRSDCFTNALLLGMGGSSLAPEVFASIFGKKPGYLDLDILDSTDPGAVRRKEEALEGKKTVYIVSSKSGGTVETASLMRYFFRKEAARTGPGIAARSFVAITDPGSGLSGEAERLRFRKIFLNDPTIGGRYSALSNFGLVPAALLGIDIAELLRKAALCEEAFQDKVHSRSPGENPLLFGAALGRLALAGRNKLTLLFSQGLAPFGAWVEQLIAESTGKNGKGILPVDGEPPLGADRYRADRFFVYCRLAGDSSRDEQAAAIRESGHPLVVLPLEDRYDLGAELYRWMIATALAGKILGINPFDQPDVEAAKVRAREMVEQYLEEGELPASRADFRQGPLAISGAGEAGTLEELFTTLSRLTSVLSGQEDSYIAIQAYLDPESAAGKTLQELRRILGEKTGLAVTLGYGPRFLHSTGQLHKGDRGSGLFLQVVGESGDCLTIPDSMDSDRGRVSFEVLKRAQASGDRLALLEKKRRVITFSLEKGHHAEALEAIISAANSALQAG